MNYLVGFERIKCISTLNGTIISLKIDFAFKGSETIFPRFQKIKTTVHFKMLKIFKSHYKPSHCFRNVNRMYIPHVN